MMITTHVITAFRQLRRNIGRSMLTMLGIVIGTASVIYILTIGEVAKEFLLGQLTQFGTNVVEIAVTGSFGPFGENQQVHLTEEDVNVIAHSSLLSQQTAIAAGTSSIQSIQHNTIRENVSVFGERPAFAVVNNMHTVKGRFLSDGDLESHRRVAVIGRHLAETLFSSPDLSLNQTFRVGGNKVTVIGVVDDLTMMAPGGTPSMIFMPITTVRELYVDAADRNTVNYMLIQFEPGTDVKSFLNRLEFELRQAHHLELNDPNPFMAIAREQFLDIFNNILLGVQVFISAVAAISLFVGGIGIMNIMLVTVQERTKEIGLRKALGASNRAIATQFLIESAVLTTVGGFIGSVIGLGGATTSVFVARMLKPDWNIQFAFVPSAIILACAVSVIVGIIFGLYPAIKASRLQPMESLRYE